MNPIPDHIDYRLRILFIGFNPSLRSAETGHHYANPHNRFWKLLYEAGLTPRKYKPYEDGELLRLGMGFTNIVARPTRTAAEITKAEYAAGRQELMQKLLHYRPAIACFVGKGVYEQFSGRTGSAIRWGVQEEAVVQGMIEYVAPSSSGLVRIAAAEMNAIYAELKACVDRLGP